VQTIVGTTAKHDDNWMTATVAEAQLIRGGLSKPAQLSPWLS
jgi:hypothetical protein